MKMVSLLMILTLSPTLKAEEFSLAKTVLNEMIGLDPEGVKEAFDNLKAYKKTCEDSLAEEARLSGQLKSLKEDDKAGKELLDELIASGRRNLARRMRGDFKDFDRYQKSSAKCTSDLFNINLNELTAKYGLSVAVNGFVSRVEKGDFKFCVETLNKVLGHEKFVAFMQSK